MVSRFEIVAFTGDVGRLPLHHTPSLGTSTPPVIIVPVILCAIYALIYRQTERCKPKFMSGYGEYALLAAPFGGEYPHAAQAPLLFQSLRDTGTILFPDCRMLSMLPHRLSATTSSLTQRPSS
ncbi:hypothetical protein BJV78DRAFT_1279475 [Lactifluus subvellereus]|nr:hypothetical protein BJV78DRAFT_1279475 [Lactifluus subvellereus]